MIPKVIHYCWFGGSELSKEAKKYIETWRSLCPEYQIVEWNETNFNVDDAVPYVKEAYEQRKWAFVSDYVRLYVLEKYGGIYFDTDVEVLKPLDVFLNNKAFIGAESKYSICTAVIGAEKGATFIGELMSLYNDLHFVDEQEIDLTPNSQRIFEYLKNTYDYKETSKPIKWENCTLYPKDYFSPINCYTYKQEITKNTYCIHRFAGTWKNEKEVFLNKLKALVTRIIGEDCRKMLKERIVTKRK